MSNLRFPARATDSRWICLVWLALVLGAGVTSRGHVDDTRVPAGPVEAQGLNAGLFAVYGPETFTRSTGAPVTERRTFRAANPASKFTLRIETFTAQGDGNTTAVASAVIRLNGTQVAAPADFSAQRRVIEKSVALLTTNQLTVEVRGKPGAKIVINIFAVDEDLPTIVATASPAPNANGWNNTPVTVTFVCSDATSGVASCPAPVLVDREGAKQVVTGEVVDRAGHRATASITLNIDRTAPVMIGTVDPAPNADGWHRSAATVSFSATDALSGIAPGSVTPPVTLSNDGSNQSVRGDARDLAGNTASTIVGGINIDRTAPALSVELSPGANANGWRKGPVTARFVCSDSGSGIASCPSDQVVSSDGQNQTVTATVSDRAGNTASVTSAPFNIDSTPPAIRVELNPVPSATGFVNTAVTARFVCEDIGSGVEDCPPEQVVAADGANHTVSGTVTDKAGNTASVTSSLFGIDRTAPVITVALTPAAPASGWYAGPVTARFTCSDALSGIASCPADRIVSTEGSGLVVSGTAVDNGGNSASVSSAPFNIDAGPPTISAAIDPLPNAAGWHNVPVTVTFTCADAGAGIQTCPQPRTITADGAGQVVTGEARDAAGHSATASVTVSVDRTPPVLQFSAPPANAVLSAAPVTVSASVADALSGLLTTSCNGAPAVPAGGVMQCAVTLTPGANAIAAAATDLAGNIATATLPLTLQTGPQVDITNPDGQTITLPAAATLTAVITDDGLPANALTIAWSLVSGPAPVTFGSPSSASTTATFTQPGTYALRVSASDGALSASDTVTLVVAPEPPPPNQAPQVDAGADQTITLPENQVALAATVTDDGLPAGSTLTQTWSRDSGPAAVTFANPSAASTTATFTAAGTYVLRLTATDGDATVFDTLTIVVNPRPNQAPQVNAGADQTIVLPAPASLSGTAIDDGLPTGALAYAWTRVSGPGGVIFGSASSPATIATFSQAGTYVLRLTVSDSALTVSDEVTIVAENPPPPPPPTNTPPVAHAGGPYSGEVNAPVAFSGLLSRDPDNDLLTYAWDFGDGAKGTGSAPTHAYDGDGSFTVTLTVSDGRGGSHTATSSVTISGQADRAPPVVTLTAPVEVLPGTDVKVVAQAVDNVGVTGLTFDVNGTNPSEGQAPPFERTISVPPIASPGSVITVRAIARDANGNTGSAQAKMTVVAVPDSEPPTVALNAPAETSPGTTLRLTAFASDNAGVASVEFLIGSTRVGLDTSAPYEASYPVPPSAQVGSQLPFTARALDYTGNRGEAAASVTVIQAPDNTPPTVALTAPPQAIAGSSIVLSAEPNDNAGVASVTFVVDGVPVATRSQAPYRVDFVVPAGIEAGALIDVVARAVDFSGLEGSDSARVRVVTAGEGVISGEVYDDATGLPLEGATVALIGEDNQGRGYTQTATSDERGRYVLRAADGQGRLRVAKSGWTAVDRMVTLQSGRAVEPIDARLTLRSPSLSITAVLAGNVADARPSLPAGGTRARLRIDPGVLTADTAISVTELSAQGIQALLPPGWSPVAVVDIAPHGVPFAGDGRVSVPNRAAIEAGRPLIVVRWDESASAWRAVESTTAPAAGADLETGVQSTGEYAWLAADAAPAVPPVPAIGDVVAGVAPALIPAGAATVVNPQPKIVLYKPGIRSDVRGLVDSAAPVTSGALLLAKINEAYLTDTGEARPDPFVQDLVLYQTAANGTSMAAAFPVTPSLTFEPLSFQHGVITVELQAPDADGRDFSVVGPDGGAVAAGTGELLEVPAGAAAAATAAHVSAVGTSELGLDIGPGLELLAAVSVNLSGTELTRSALLSINRPAHIATSEGLLVARLQHVVGATRLVLVGTARVAGERIFSDTALPGSTIALEGVTVGGRYLFVRAIAPLGFAAGSVLGVGGQAFQGAVISSSTLPLIALSRNGGAYVAAASTGAVVLTAVDLARNDTGSSQGTITANQVAAVDLRLQTERPRVLTISPAAGAVNVAPTSPIVAKFSEPIHPASVSGANTSNVRVVPAGGSPVTGTLTLSANNTTVTFRPLQPLEPNTSYTVTLAQAIADSAGNPLESAFVATFTSLDTTAPPPPPAGSITASIPQNGTTTIVATQGTAAAHDTVSVVNVTRGTFTPVLVNANGGFEVVVPAGVQDRLQIKIVDQVGNETVVPLAAFARVNPDGSRSTVVGPDGGLLTGPDGILVDVPGGAFDAPTVVTITSVAEAQFPVALTPEQRQVFAFAGGIALDFDGATPKAEIDVSLPAKGTETPQDRWVLTRVQTINGVQLLTVADTARVIENRIVTASPPCPGVEAAGIYGFLKPEGTIGLAFGTILAEPTFEMPPVISISQPYLGAGPGNVRLPYNLLASPIDKPNLVCLPVITGRVTVTPNTQYLIIPASQFTPADRQIVVRNTTTGAQTYHPRNVVEFKFRVPGRPTDKYSVRVVTFEGPQQDVPFEVSDGPEGQSIVRIDVDRVHFRVSEVVIRNLSSAPGLDYRFPQNTAVIRMPVSGGGGVFEVYAVDANGGWRPITEFTAEAPTGAQSLVMKARPATIDPNTTVSLVRSDDERIDSNDPREAMTAPMIEGGFVYAFDGSIDTLYGIDVRYNDGRPGFSAAIPRVQAVLTNPITGRVIRTITLPAPPEDEPFTFGVISADPIPAVLRSGPSNLHNFDPASFLTFVFSKPIDRASVQDAVLKDAAGVTLKLSVVMSQGHTKVTFTPAAPLKMGTKYTLTAANIRDTMGNVLDPLNLEITTSAPRPAGSVSDVQLGGLRDIVLMRTKTGHPHAFTISNDPNTMITFNVNNPGAPTRTIGYISDGKPTRGALLRGANIPSAPRGNPCAAGAQSFTGDLVFVARTFRRSTDHINSLTNSLIIYDVNNPAIPCEAGIKLLSQGGSNEPVYAPGAIQGTGTASGVTALAHNTGVYAYVAVANLGLMLVDIGRNIGPFTYESQVRETLYPGDYTDVLNIGNRLAAIEATNKTVDFFDASLGLQQSLTTNIAGFRLAHAPALTIDLNGNGTVDFNEVRDLLFVGGQGGNIGIVDVTNPGGAVVVGTIPVPGVVWALEVDAAKNRVMALVNRPAMGNDLGVLMFELSGKSAFSAADVDGDGQDDRLVWQSPQGLYSGSNRALRFDPERRLLFVGGVGGGAGNGFEIWSVDNVCCDLGAEMVAPRPRPPSDGDREIALLREKKALQKAIADGLNAIGGGSTSPSCGIPPQALSIIEQGSGACLWKGDNLLGQCSTTYQPGVSDHDFEVFIPEEFLGPAGDVASPATCVARTLNEQFTKSDGSPKEIIVDGVGVTFDDVTFFAVNRTLFESGELDLAPPKPSGGDATGDLGLGRQQLLLKWLLEGEYIDVPGYDVAGRPLNEILESFKAGKAIPGLEGHEWGHLQRYNLTKSKAFVRFKGASNASSSLHGLYIRQLHDAGKAGIRAALARMVADPQSRSLVLNVRRNEDDDGDGLGYGSDACLDIHPTSAPAPPWQAKPCSSFEEYVASAAARSSLFTPPQVVSLIHKFYRVKSGVDPPIENETEADGFIADVSSFIDGVIEQTKAVYDAEIANVDQTERTRREENLTSAVTLRDKAKRVSIQMVPRVFNKGFRIASNLEVSMYRSAGPAAPAPPVKTALIDLGAGEDRFLEHDPAPAPPRPVDITTADRNLLDLSRDYGTQRPMFVLGEEGNSQNPIIDTDARLGELQAVSFTIDLPKRTQKEADRHNNYDGFFFYVLDRSNPTAPPSADKPGLPILDPDGALMKPDPECVVGPQLLVTQTMEKYAGLVSFSDVVTFDHNEIGTLKVKVRNDSGLSIPQVVACTELSLAGCTNVGNMAPYTEQEVSFPYVAGTTSRTFDAVATATAPMAGVFSSPPLRVIVGCEPYVIAPYGSDPHPAVYHEVMRGGSIVRYYRVLTRGSGVPLAGKLVTLQIKGPQGIISTQHMTDAAGRIVTGDDKAIVIPIGAQYAANDVLEGTITTVDGTAPYCSGEQKFFVKVNDRTFTRSWLGGSSLGVEGAIELGLSGKSASGISFTLTDTAGKGHSTLAVGQTFSLGFGVLEKLAETGGRLEIGPVKVQRIASAKAGVSALYATSTAHDFTFNADGQTLPATSNFALGVLLGTSLGTHSSTSTRALVAAALKAPDVRTFQSSDKLALGVEGTFSPKAEIVSGIQTGSTSGTPDGSINYGFEASTGLGVKVGAEVAVEDKQLTGEIVTSFELKGALDFTTLFGAGTGSQGPPPKPDDALQFRKIGLVDKAKLVIRDGFASSVKGSLSQKLEQTPNGPRFVPSKLELAISGTKTGGWTLGPSRKDLVSIDAAPGTGGKRTFKYTLTDPALLKAVFESLQALTGLRLDNPVAPFIISETHVREEVDRLIDLVAEGFRAGNVTRGVNLDYEVSEDQTNAASLPIGGTVSIFGISLDLSTALQLDRTISYTLEKGVIRDGDIYVLAKYQKDALIPDVPSGIVDDMKTITDIAINAMTSAGSTPFDAVKRLVSSGSNSVRSNNTAQLDFDGTNETIPEVAVISYTYETRPVADRPFAMRPQSVYGPAGKPHYGIGGFHEFYPARHVFAQPATLTIFYQDSEVAGLDESRLGIYRWNAARSDWDYLGGTRNLAANTVTTTVDRTGLYTLAPSMPAGKIALTVQSTSVGSPQNPQTISTYTSAPILNNSGEVVRDGSLFTVMGVLPSVDAAPFGTVLTEDADLTTPGIQVRSLNGVIQFVIEYAAADGASIPLVFSNEGTALAIDTIAIRAPEQ